LKIRDFISKKLIQVLIGIFIGAFILTVSTVNVTYESKKDTKEQSSSGERELQITRAEAITSSPGQINVEFQSFLLEEVVFVKDDDLKKPVDILGDYTQKVFKILFRSIISPNAP